MTLNRNFNFERDDNFKDLLPITGSVNYMETKYNLSQIDCAGSCVFCAGFLYNSGTGTCHLLKTRLVERSLNRSRIDIGWNLYNSLNVCNSGWYIYNTHCYTFVEMRATWEQAKNYCASTGAYLVQIETSEDNEWIKETLKPALKGTETCSDQNPFCCDTWVGASDHVEEGFFQWTNTENVVFTNWVLGEPNNSDGNENCVALCPALVNGMIILVVAF